MKTIFNQKISDFTVGELLAILDNIREDKNKKEEDTIQKVTSLLSKLGIPANLKGHKYIRYAIILSLEDITVLDSITGILYPTIAKEYGVTSSRVERAIRYAIEVSFNRGNIKLVHNIFGYTIDIEKGKLTNSEFLATLTDYLAHNS